MLKFKIKFFLSYSAIDNQEASKFKERLLDFPFIDVFMAPDDIPPGVVGNEYILNEIKNCDYFIMYVTKNYHKSNFTEQEVGAAWAFGKQIIPCKTSNKIKICGIPNAFQIKIIPDFYNSSIADFLLKLYGQFGSNEDFIDYMIEKELTTSTNYARSNTIFTIIKKLTPTLNDPQTHEVLKAFCVNSQVASKEWLGVIKRYLAYENGFLSLNEKSMYSEVKTKGESFYGL